MSEKLRVLMLHQSWKGFERRDYEILKNNFSAQEILFYKNILTLPLAIKKIINSQVVFCWFAYRASLIPLVVAKLFKKKIVLVVGGWDCVNLPEINHGAMRRGWRFVLTRLITKFIANLADRIIAVSENNRKEIIGNLKIPLDKIELIYHGIHLDCCKNDDDFSPKQQLVLTVGDVTKNNLKRKGLEVFIKTAKLLPHIDFFLAGAIDNKMRDYLSRKYNIPENLTITGWVPQETLHKFYRKAKVYVQVSYHEQFGCALAEAMAHKCVPVVTNRGALSEVVGDTGYYVPYGDIEKTAQAITLALKDDEKGRVARERIVRLFSFKKREDYLVKLINSIVNQ